MARKKSYLAKSNRGNLLGTLVHNCLVDHANKQKQEAISSTHRARALARRAKAQATEVARKERDAERRKKKHERDKIKKEKELKKELKMQEAELKRLERENERIQKYQAKLELQCKKHQIDVICVELMAKEAYGAGLCLGKELADLIILGREDEWRSRALTLSEAERTEMLTLSVDSWLEIQKIYDHEQINQLVNQFRAELAAGNEPVKEAIKGKIWQKYTDLIQKENIYLRSVSENAKITIDELNILPEYGEDFLEMLINDRIEPGFISECEITKIFIEQSQTDRQEMYVSAVEFVTEKLLKEDKVLEGETDGLREDLIGAILDIDLLEDNHIVFKYISNRQKYEEELEARILTHVS